MPEVTELTSDEQAMNSHRRRCSDPLYFSALSEAYPLPFALSFPSFALISGPSSNPQPPSGPCSLFSQPLIRGLPSAFCPHAFIYQIQLLIVMLTSAILLIHCQLDLFTFERNSTISYYDHVLVTFPFKFCQILLYLFPDYAIRCLHIPHW